MYVFMRGQRITLHTLSLSSSLLLFLSLKAANLKKINILLIAHFCLGLDISYFIFCTPLRC